jgi:hypothetical protein
VGITAITVMLSGTLGFNLRFMSLENYFRVPTYYFMMFAVVPWSLAFLYGIYRAVKSGKGEGAFALIAFFTVFIFFNMLVWKEMRFILFVIPMFAVLVGMGLKGMRKEVKYAIVALLFVLCFAESMLLLDTSADVTWGTDIMTEEMASLPESALIALDTSFIYRKDIYDRVTVFPPQTTAGWIEDSGADYVILSLYGEIARGADESHYKPKLGPIDAPFLGGDSPKNILSWWPGHEFSSDLYREINAKYPVLKRIQREGQDVFIIYDASD